MQELTDVKQIVSRLVAERRVRGIAQVDVSKATGISQAAISDVEMGKTQDPKLRTLINYAGGLGLKLVFDIVEMTDDERAEAAERSSFG